MKNDLKLTTKGSGNSYKNSGFISGALYVAMGVVAILIPAFVGFKEKGVLLLAFLGLVCLFWGLIEISVKRTHGNTYVEFYEDYIQGVGIHGSTVDRFSFENNKIQSITVGNKTRNVMMINIKTIGGEYKVITNKEVADQVFSYVNVHINKN